MVTESMGIARRVNLLFPKELRQFYSLDMSLEDRSKLVPIGEPELLIGEENTSHLDTTVIEVSSDKIPSGADSYICGMPEYRRVERRVSGKITDGIRAFVPIQFYKFNGNGAS